MRQAARSCTRIAPGIGGQRQGPRRTMEAPPTTKARTAGHGHTVRRNGRGHGALRSRGVQLRDRRGDPRRRRRAPVPGTRSGALRPRLADRHNQAHATEGHAVPRRREPLSRANGGRSTCPNRPPSMERERQPHQKDDGSRSSPSHKAGGPRSILARHMGLLPQDHLPPPAWPGPRSSWPLPEPGVPRSSAPGPGYIPIKII